MSSTRRLIRHNRENFPVASWILPRRMRAPVMHFYRFAREADDIADDPQLAAEEKLARLEAVDRALVTGDPGALPDWAASYADDIAAGRAPLEPGRDLLVAFCRDAWKTRYADMGELWDYCRYSAAPVGRAVLAIGREEQADLRASDALCHVLQILNHIQDIGEDYRRLDRIYLPQDWLREEGVADMAALGAEKLSPALRRVVDRVLAAAEAELARAEPLAASVRSKRLRLEIRWIEELAWRLLARLREGDMLAAKVKLSPLEVLGCFRRACWRREGREDG